MQVKIFNTASAKEEVIQTIEENHLKLYVCGPTVYDRPHLGNARSAVIYDMFVRFFREIYQNVTFVRNITDVDDKINKAAQEQNISIQELTSKIITLFHKDLDQLNVLRPDLEPKATDHIKDMIKMIERLIDNGFAYESEGHVLFDVANYKEYGALSHRSLDEMIAGARVEVATYKKNPLDFVLWKPANEKDDISSVFDSPWSKGRPGWHIECSAMSVKYLGENFDIHGGGADLQFPHHENEIAQSRCSNLGSDYAKYWIHNGFLTVNGEKMSKSLKNFVTVNDLLEKGEEGVAIRLLLLSSHYRKPLDFSEKALDDAKKSINKFYSVFDSALLEKYYDSEFDFKESAFRKQILEFLADDLNLSKVFAFLHSQVKDLKKSDDDLKISFVAVLDFLGLLNKDYFQSKKSDIDEQFILDKIQQRKEAKQNKNYKLADEIRDELLKNNVILEDKAGGIVEWKIMK